VSKLNY